MAQRADFYCQTCEAIVTREHVSGGPAPRCLLDKLASAVVRIAALEDRVDALEAKAAGRA